MFPATHVVELEVTDVPTEDFDRFGWTVVIVHQQVSHIEAQAHGIGEVLAQLFPIAEVREPMSWLRFDCELHMGLARMIRQFQ